MPSHPSSGIKPQNARYVKPRIDMCQKPTNTAPQWKLKIADKYNNMNKERLLYNLPFCEKEKQIETKTYTQDSRP